MKKSANKNDGKVTTLVMTGSDDYKRSFEQLYRIGDTVLEGDTSPGVQTSDGFYLSPALTPPAPLGDGLYDATVEGVFPHLVTHDGQEIALGFLFRLLVHHKDQAGTTPAVFYRRLSLRPDSRFLRTMAAIVGRKLTAAELQGRIHTSQIVGRRCKVRLYRQKEYRWRGVPRLGVQAIVSDQQNALAGQG
jgi:hypothetical protein